MTDTLPTLNDWVSERTAQLESQFAAKDAGRPPLLHVPTGLGSLDDLGLLEPGVLTAVLAHSSDGKTALMMQFLKGAAQAGMKGQGYFYEDPQDKLSDRVIAAELGVSAFKLRRLDVPGTAEEVNGRLAAARASLGWTSLITVDSTRSTVDGLMAKIRERHVPGETKIVGVDYAQAFDAEGSENSVERVVSRLAWRLNEYAKYENVAVVLLSQVRREVLDRGRRWFENWRWKNPRGEPSTEAVEGFRPLEGDMQWSSAVQQRARQVLSVFRPGSWMRSLGFHWDDDVMEVQLCKGSYGPGRGREALHWDGPTCVVSDGRRKGR